MLDITSGAGLLIDQRNRQAAQRAAVNQAMQQQIIGGLGNAAQGFHGWQQEQKQKADEEKAKQALKAWWGHLGGDPNDPGLDDIETAKAMIAQTTEDQRREATRKFQLEQMGRGQNFDVGMQERQFAHSDAQRAAEDAQRQAMQTTLGGQESALRGPITEQQPFPAIGPATPPPSSLFPGLQTTRDPTETDVNRRAADAARSGKPYMQQALQGAYSRMPRPTTPKRRRKEASTRPSSSPAMSSCTTPILTGIRNPKAKGRRACRRCPPIT